MREPPMPVYLTPETFAELVGPLQGPLCGFARGMVGAMEQARDIVQDVLVDAWRTARRGTPPFSISPDPGEMRRWLFHAVFWRAARLSRHDRLLAWEPLETVELSAAMFTRDVPRFEDTVVEGEVLRAALARLSPRDAATIMLNVVHGFTAAEIAIIVGSTHEATKRRLSRAKERLRVAYFAQETPTPERAKP
jgi:RNA polymerase sigma-70 factor (ECF subfamily)